MGYEMRTRKGHSFFVMSSMLQKAIRRGEARDACYALGELYSGYPFYTWRKLLTISAEDCYGVITKEVLALYQADMEVNKKCRSYDDRNTIFICKAVVLLLHCAKNRDADYVACNMLDSAKLEEEAPLAKKYGIDDQTIRDEFPDYVYDVHTSQGKAMGKTREDFAKDELDALVNRKPGLFDEWAWDFS